MINIIFYDTTWNELLRVGNVVAKVIKNNAKVWICGVVFETSDNKIVPSKDKHYFDKVVVTQNIKNINKTIKIIKPDLVVFAQNTIPDLAAILFSRKNGAKIYMMQHGLLYDGASLNNVRLNEIFAALLKAKKTYDYLNVLRVMCVEGKKSFVNALFTILWKRRNVTTIIQNYFYPPLRGDIAFVIGEHWVNYYHESYGYEKKSIYVMGNHDVDDLKDKYQLEDAICYIPSVHVEDGKVQPHVFKVFLEKLAAAIPNGKKLYIKLHPRSNKSLYLDTFKNRDVEYISGIDLPFVKVYVGHNSSLLSKALQISGTVILWRFKEEKDLFYKDFAVAVCDDLYSLKKAFEKVSSIDYIGKKAEIEQYSYKNPLGAYQYCAMKIIELMNV